MPRIPGSLHALLAGLIDYAGWYPPACLPLAIVSERYNGFLHSPERWILNRLVLPASVLPEVKIESNWRVSLVVEEEPGPLPPQIETLETKLSRPLSLPTYCEAPLPSIQGAFAKFRTGGLTPEMIPAAEPVADFLVEAAERRIPFKATAGLHHPFRSIQALSYDRESPRATVHGFLNLFTAALLAWRGAARPRVVEALDDQDIDAFRFEEDGLRWRDEVIGTVEIRDARQRFAHSFGSCSFEEPVSDLQHLGLLA